MSALVVKKFGSKSGTKEEVMRLADSILMEIDQEAQTTKRVLERIPEDKLTRKPHPKSHSLGQLALHIASVPGRTKNGKVIMSVPRIGFIRSILMNHNYHQRWKPSVYLRTCDVPVRSIYGPSADENPFA